jgi:large subunit ribosomal protein L5
MNNKEFIDGVKEKIAKEFAVKNVNALPRLAKISVSLRVGRYKEDQKSIESAREELRTITGQRPSERISKKSISSFKLKSGDMVGFLVTLRGDRMWSFLQKLVKVVLPSVRDFSGTDPRSIDHQGNLSIGFKDQTPFPEIDPNKIDKLRGVGVTLTTSLFDSTQSQKFFECIGFVFSKTR